MYSTLVVFAMIGSVLSVPTAETDVALKVYKRVPPMSFDCSSLVEICNSMCWGAFCTNPSFGQTLTYDAADASTKRSRRTSAGCLPGPNRCSTKHDPPYQSGYSCDEYPFASTSDADKGGQTNRCVPAGENSSQGGIISNYLKNSCNCGNCQFIVGFGNPDAAGVKYCDDDLSKCIPDGNVFKGQNEDVAPPTKMRRGERKGGLYLTERGMKVSFATDMPLGTVINHAQLRARGAMERRVADAKMTLEGRAAQDDPCGTGDGDTIGDDSDDGGAKLMKKRISLPEEVPEYEFIEDVIVKKLN